ncbi:MAG: hypothetical protein PUD25_02950, partial [Bacilli bacterium]|nr:hypothetical protein [Bacilli bacterium]
YEQLNARNSSYSELKSEIDGDDRVKNAQTAYNAKLSKYVEDGKGTAEDFAASPDGVNYSQYIKNAQEAAYADNIASDEVFQTKVSVHNKRFGTKYGTGTTWETINNDRKATKKEFELAQARKPK